MTTKSKTKSAKTGHDFGARLMIGVDGLQAPSAADIKRLRHPAVGGVILFAHNFADAQRLRQLTANIRRAAGRQILIATDQEGGRVQRFCGGDAFVKLPAAADYKDASKAEAGGIVMAAQLLAAGVDMSFAPVLDMRGKSKVIGRRAFAKDSKEVYALASAFARGMHRAGMHCCGKHFPGHGNVAADSHKVLPKDNRAFDTIAANDLLPFAAWARAKYPALMTAHIEYPKIDNAAATFSSFWLRDILRRRLGFGGLIISDDLSMRGANIGTIGERMKSARAAGCDLLLVCGREEIDDALAAATPASTKATNQWLTLSPLPNPEIQLNSPDYTRAYSVIPA